MSDKLSDKLQNILYFSVAGPRYPSRQSLYFAFLRLIQSTPSCLQLEYTRCCGYDASAMLPLDYHATFAELSLSLLLPSPAQHRHRMLAMHVCQQLHYGENCFFLSPCVLRVAASFIVLTLNFGMYHHKCYLTYDLYHQSEQKRSLPLPLLTLSQLLLRWACSSSCARRRRSPPPLPPSLPRVAEVCSRRP